MMSTAIPARLEFQCGHAALVSLPRIKGESSAERNTRIAREKSAALTRACDFCAQRLEVVVQAAPPVEAVASAPVVLATVAEEAPAVLATVEVEEDVAPPALADVLAPSAPVVEDIAAPAPPAEDVPLAVVIANGVNGHSAPPRRKRAPAQQKSIVRATPVVPVALERFIIHYRVERVLGARDIRDALRQAEILGATDVLAITRER